MYFEPMYLQQLSGLVDRLSAITMPDLFETDEKQRFDAAARTITRVVDAWSRGDVPPKKWTVQNLRN